MVEIFPTELWLVWIVPKLSLVGLPELSLTGRGLSKLWLVWFEPKYPKLLGCLPELFPAGREYTE